MTVTAQTASGAVAEVGADRRNAELGLMVLAWGIGLFALAQVLWATGRSLNVTFWIVVFSPVPVCCSLRFHPSAGTNESIPNPLGGVSSTFVVVSPSCSVGTASVNS